MDKAVEALFGALGWDKAQPKGPDAVTRVVLANALTAADEARAVTDEEIIKTVGWTAEYPKAILASLHAAGFKVIRG